MTEAEEHFAPVQFEVVDFDPSADAPLYPDFFGTQASLHFVPLEGRTALAWVWHQWDNNGENREWLGSTSEGQIGAMEDDAGNWTRVRYWLAVLPGTCREFDLRWHEMEDDGLGHRSVKETRHVRWRENPNAKLPVPPGFSASDPLTWPRVGAVNGYYLRARPTTALSLAVSWPSGSVLERPWFLFPPHDGFRVFYLPQMPGVIAPFADYLRPVVATLPTHILSLPEPLI